MNESKAISITCPNLNATNAILLDRILTFSIKGGSKKLFIGLFKEEIFKCF